MTVICDEIYYVYLDKGRELGIPEKCVWYPRKLGDFPQHRLSRADRRWLILHLQIIQLDGNRFSLISGISKDMSKFVNDCSLETEIKCLSICRNIFGLQSFSVENVFAFFFFFWGGGGGVT